MTAHFNGRNGTETLLCDVIVVLNIDAFLLQWVLHGEGFGSKYKSYFTWEMAEEFTCCSAGIVRLFFVVFLSNSRLTMFHSEVKNRRYRVFLNYKLMKLERGPNKLLTTRFCLKLSSVKCFTQTCKCFDGMKHFLFIFIHHSLLSFGSWGNLKVLTFDFEQFSSEVHCEVETKQFSISHISWAHQQWRQKFYFRQLSDNFPDRSTIMKDKKQWF